MKKPAQVPKTPPTRKPRRKKLTREKIKSLYDDALRKRFWSEKEVVQMLPQILKRITSYELSSAVRELITVSEQQLLRLIRIFDVLGERAAGNKDFATYEILAVLDLIRANDDFGYATDANILIGCREVIELAIEAYSDARAHAAALEETQATALLDEALSAENKALRQMRQIQLPSIYFDQTG